MRRASLWAIAVLVLWALQALGLQSHPHSRPGERQANAEKKQSAPEGSVVDATGIGSPIVLNKGWRVGVTSNPAAASPGFDDSGWAIRDANGTMADVSDSEDPDPDVKARDDKYAWFRLHVRLAQNHGPVALLIELPVTQSAGMSLSTTGPAPEVFVNGKLVLPGGPHPDDQSEYAQISRLYKLDIPPEQTSMVLAVRTWYVPFGLKGYTNFFDRRTFRLGVRTIFGRASICGRYERSSSGYLG